MKTLEYYLSLPWTIVAEEHDDDGEYLLVQISELPGLIVTGTEEEVQASLFDALASHILSYLLEDEEPPIPEHPIVVSYQWSEEGPILHGCSSGVSVEEEDNYLHRVSA